MLRDCLHNNATQFDFKRVYNRNMFIIKLTVIYWQQLSSSCCISYHSTITVKLSTVVLSLLLFFILFCYIFNNTSYCFTPTALLMNHLLYFTAELQ